MSAMPTVTADSLIAILDNLKAEFLPIMDRLELSAPAPALGEWVPRQVLSHIIGSLNRVPVHAGYYFADTSYLPITYSDPYWNEAWHDAPIQSFRAAFLAAIEGNKAFVRSLSTEDFGRTITATGFGDTPLGLLMMVSYNNHVKGQHLHQLAAFISVTEPA